MVALKSEKGGVMVRDRMGDLDMPQGSAEKGYFYKTQVKKVKAVEPFMTKDLHRRHTIEELSRQFDMPMTTLKQC